MSGVVISARRLALSLCLCLLGSLLQAQSLEPYCDELESLDISYFKSYGALFGEQGNVVLQLSNGNVATGMQLSNPAGGGPVYPGLLLTNPAGEKIFCKKYTDFPSPNAIQHMLANELGFLVAGVSWLMQTDSLGEVLWCKQLSIGTSFAITDLKTNAQGYVIAGITHPSTTGYPDIACLQLDTAGEVLWATQIESYDTQLRSVRILPMEEGYLLAATGKKGTFTGILLMHLDSLAHPLWNKYYDTFYDDELAAFLMDESGDVYLIGRNYSIPTEWDPFIFKVDTAGTLLESIHLDGNGQDESPRCATLFAGDRMALSFDHGNTSSRSPAVASLSLNDFSIDWCRSYAYEPQFTNYVLDITPALNGGLLMVGDMHITGKIRDTYLIHTRPDGDAGCYTSDYSLAPITKEVEVTEYPFSADSASVQVSEMSVAAYEDFAVVEFEACEQIPPCADFDLFLSSVTECEEQCYLFQDQSSFNPSTWEWAFENGQPSSYTGQDPPEVCWTMEGTHQVQLTVSSEGGEHVSTTSIHVDFGCPPVFPNVITPNDDGLNDAFVIKYLPSDFRLSIFNRWGQALFVTDNPNHHWDGRVEGTGIEASDGVYYYEMHDISNELRYSGYVQVMRGR
jgi:gliding motility-associated-like protein